MLSVEAPPEMLANHILHSLSEDFGPGWKKANYKMKIGRVQQVLFKMVMAWPTGIDITQLQFKLNSILNQCNVLLSSGKF